MNHVRPTFFDHELPSEPPRFGIGRCQNGMSVLPPTTSGGGAKTASRWWGNIPLSSFWVSLKRRIDYNIFRIVHRLPLHKWPLHSAIPQCPPNWMHYLQIFGKITTLAVLPGYCSLSFCTGSLWSSLTYKYWLHMQLGCCETYILIFTQRMAMVIQVCAWHSAIQSHIMLFGQSEFQIQVYCNSSNSVQERSRFPQLN